MGQIATADNGIWKCKEPALKAKDSPARAGSGTATINAKAAPKPDFVILGAKRVNGTGGAFSVRIKNQGAAATSKGTLWANHHMAQNGGTASASVYMPSFNGGETKNVVVTFNPDNFKRGDRVLFTADYFKEVAESNENNNTHAMNYN
jgi:subtilase family serine protease